MSVIIIIISDRLKTRKMLKLHGKTIRVISNNALRVHRSVKEHSLFFELPVTYPLRARWHIGSQQKLSMSVCLLQRPAPLPTNPILLLSSPSQRSFSTLSLVSPYFFFTPVSNLTPSLYGSLCPALECGQ